MYIQFKTALPVLLTVMMALGNIGHVLASDGEPIVIKFSHVVSEDTPKGQGAKMFQRLVEEQLGDRVKVEVYPNSSLYNEAKGINALITGDVQMLAPSLAKLGQYSKRVQLFDLPFLFDDMDAVTRFEGSESGKKILQSMTNHNIIGLAYWHNGMRQLSANKPLIEPRDMRGLKLRVEQSNIIDAQIREVHALPRKMAFNEVYQGMQTGVVEGQGGNTWSNIYSQKWYQVQSDITEANSGVLDYMVVTNSQFWNGLPDDIRSKLSDILMQVTKTVNDQAAQLNQQAKQNIIDAGGTDIHHLNQDQLSKWREAMKPVIGEFRDEIGAGIVRAAQQSNHGDS